MQTRERRTLTRRRALLGLVSLIGAGLVLGAPGHAAQAGSAAPPGKRRATLYKDPACGCCEGYVAYLRRNGIAVETVDTEALDQAKTILGVPAHLRACHSMLLGGYVVEGHVPISVLRRLLAERPKIPGIALPGMPAGSPGMSGTKEGPFTVYVLAPGKRRVYAVE